MKNKIISETPMNLVEVKEELKKVQKRDQELNFRAQKTVDYLNPVAKLTLKQAGEIKTALEKLKILRLKEVHMQKLIDVLPTAEEDVNVVLQGYTLNLKKEDMKKIAVAIKGIVPETKK
jgi:DNA-directed RNA polymerase subunit F